ncbi:molybdopterin converting factor subunit 1 [candidate division KSB1 bacterium]
MIINLEFFAVVREIAGVDNIKIEIPAGSNKKDLLKHVIKRWPKLKKSLEEVSFAVNEEFVFEDFKLKDKDEVCLIPPVSGG